MSRCCPPTIILLVAVFSLPITSVKLVASPLPPNVRVSRSTNGRFLVLTEREYDNPDPRAVRRIVRTTYRVMEAENFINSKDRLTTPAPFWSESALSWQVTPEGNDGMRVFWPLISNDGQSLVLVGVTAAVPGGAVLKIYRKKMFEGNLVRSFQITDLWTANEVDPDGKGIFTVTDATPEWFAGGFLAFSPDDQTLIYRTQWNDRVSIRLVDGVISTASVSIEPALPP
jgi:hypothetical protein